MSRSKPALKGISRRILLKMAGIAAASVAIQGAGLPLFSNHTYAQSGSFPVEYRKIPKSGIKLSTVGIGAGNLRHTSPEEIANVVDSVVTRLFKNILYGIMGKRRNTYACSSP